MVVIAHEAQGENAAVESRERPTQDFQDGLAVGVVFEDGLAPVTSRDLLLESARKLDA